MMCFRMPLGRCFKATSGCLLLGDDVLCEQGADIVPALSLSIFSVRIIEGVSPLGRRVDSVMPDIEQHMLNLLIERPIQGQREAWRESC